VFYRLPASSKIFDKIINGTAAIATKSGTHAPSHDKGVAPHNLHTIKIADSGVQITITSNAAM
jgi:hypothetical protein